MQRYDIRREWDSERFVARERGNQPPLVYIAFDDITEMSDKSFEAIRRRPWAAKDFEESHLRERKIAAWIRGDTDVSLRSFRDVAEKCVGTWESGLKQFERMRDRLAEVVLPAPQSVRRRPAYRDDDGDEICIDRLKTGKPDFWRTTTKQRATARKQVTIVTAIGAMASIDTAKLMWRGVAAVVLCDKLEEAGYSVEIIGCQYVNNGLVDRKTNSEIDFASSVILKRHGEPLDVSTLVSITSGWARRTLWFYSYGCADDYTPTGSFGASKSLRPIMKHLTDDENAFLSEEFWSFDEAVTWLRNTLDRVANSEPAAA